MSYLLEIYRDKSMAMKGKKNMPLMAEVDVHPDTGPYLVSGAKTPLLWVEEPHGGTHVKAGVRQIDSPGKMFLAVLLSVEIRGRRDEWGNVHPFTPEGLQAAIDHVDYYEQGDLEVLIPRVRGEKAPDEREKDEPFVAANRPEWLHPREFQLPFRPSSWLPDNCAVVVPRDRGFVGRMTHLGPKMVFVVVHNASRGIGIARSGPLDELARPQ